MTTVAMCICFLFILVLFPMFHIVFLVGLDNIIVYYSNKNLLL